MTLLAPRPSVLVPPSSAPTVGLHAAPLRAAATHQGLADLAPLVAGLNRPAVAAEVATALHRLRIAAHEGHLSPGDHERAAVLLELLVELTPA